MTSRTELPTTATTPPTAPPLSDDDRARGRRIAISSHPAAMTFWMVFTEHLPTLFLVSLGASEVQVGLQRAFLPGLQLLQLPTLRAISRWTKRQILFTGQVFALVGALPLLLLETIGPVDPSWARSSALTSLAAVAAGLQIGNTVWFPLLRGYVEPGQIARFFGLLRSGWHLALMLYYAFAQLWLAHFPGRFVPLFGLGWLLGLLRCALILRMPERSERSGRRIRIRETVALVRDDASLRRLLLGTAANGALRSSVIPFAIVMLRREIGFSESQVILCTFASYAGGLASLYVWGRVCDRFGAPPVFRATTFGLAILTAMLVVVDGTDPGDLLVILVFFGGHAVFTSGFGVADTQVLFRLTPADAPARTLVIAGVLTSAVAALAPIIVGLVLQWGLSTTQQPLGVYRTFFVLAALAQLCVQRPLRGLEREPEAP